MAQGQCFTVNSEHSLKCAQEYLAKTWNEKKWLEMRLNTDKTRSGLQNSSLHLYCQQLADALNDAGYHYVIVINGKETECNWDKEMVKRFMWKPVQKALTDKKSTTEASTVEVSEIYETLNRFTADKFYLSVPWPSRK